MVFRSIECGKNTFSRQTWGQSLIVNPNGKILSDLGNKVGYDVLDLIND